MKEKLYKNFYKLLLDFFVSNGNFVTLYVKLGLKPEVIQVFYQNLSNSRFF